MKPPFPGFFGEVFRGVWNGTEVAIKVFLEQDLTAENMEDFCNEISILRCDIWFWLFAGFQFYWHSIILTRKFSSGFSCSSRLRHPNGTSLQAIPHTCSTLMFGEKSFWLWAIANYNKMNFESNLNFTYLKQYGKINNINIVYYWAVHQIHRTARCTLICLTGRCSYLHKQIFLESLTVEYNILCRSTLLLCIHCESWPQTHAVSTNNVPAVILFLGACMKPPRLSLVTEYMEMGSLYYLIHLSGQKNKLSWRRRIKMLRDICRSVETRAEFDDWRSTESIFSCFGNQGADVHTSNEDNPSRS